MKNVRAVKIRPLRDHAILATVVGLFILLVIYGVYQILQLITHTQPAVPASSSKTNQPSVLGESVDAKINFTVKSHEYIEQSGKKYLRIHAVIANNTGVTVQFSPLLQLEVLASDNSRFPFTADLSAQPLGGPIQNGKLVEGTMDFSIGKGSDIRAILFRDSPTSSFQTITLTP